MNIQGWFPLGLTGLILLSRVFSSTTIRKHQFLGTQPSLWSNTHIHTWLLEKPKLWLDGLLTAKVCFLICCLGVSSVLLPGKSHGERSLVGCSPWDREESDTTEWLHFPFSLPCIGEGNGNPLQCCCLENPRDWGAWWAAVYGVAQSRTRLKRLSSSSRRVITFLPRSRCLLISWLQSPSTVSPRKSATASTFFPSICHEVMGPDAIILVFWMLNTG